MSVAKSLSPEQIAEIQSWADNGANLSDIQKRLASEMQVKVTYMEMRFLIEDIGVTFPPEPEPEPEPEVEEEPEAESAVIDDADSASGQPDEKSSAKVPGADITVDELVRPGMIVSGKVTFEGADTLGWYLDETGRLGIDPGEGNEFRPSEEQVKNFQTNLQIVLKEKGFG